VTGEPWWEPGVIPQRRAPGAPVARVPIPGLADWATRASAALIEISIAGGVATAYSVALLVARPVFALVEAVALVCGVHLESVFVDLYGALPVAFLVWQWVLRGTTGQSLGQRIMRIVLVDEDLGCPVGAARSVLRSSLHVLDVGACFFGYVRPVFQYRRQTWADQICRTVVVSVDTINKIAEVKAT
jgi:uncharacterized RDD family membrane protein YckC